MPQIVDTVFDACLVVIAVANWQTLFQLQEAGRVGRAQVGTSAPTSAVPFHTSR
jgi:hypothetical protein